MGREGGARGVIDVRRQGEIQRVERSLRDTIRRQSRTMFLLAEASADRRRRRPSASPGHVRRQVAQQAAEHGRSAPARSVFTSRWPDRARAAGRSAPARASRRRRGTGRAAAASAAATPCGDVLRRRHQQPHQPPERRVAEPLAALELAVQELLHGVAGGERAPTRPSGSQAWTITAPAIARPPRAARELRQQRERPLLGAEVGQGQPRLGVDHRGQLARRERRGPWRRSACRPARPGRPRGSGRASPPARPPRRDVGVQPQHLEAREPLDQIGLDALRARADPRQVDRSAVPGRPPAHARAVRSGGRRSAAAPVERERDVAARAAPRSRARPAVQRRRVAAPVLAAGSRGRRSSSSPPARRAAAARTDTRRRGAGRPPRPGGSRPPMRAGSSSRRRTPATPPAAASRCRIASRSRPRCARAWRPPRGRRSAGRTRACTTRRAPRRSRSGPGRAPAANTAERAPTTTRASPAAMRACSAPLRAGVSALCSTATVSPNRATNRPAVCGVSAISGTSTTAPLPCASARSITAQVDLGLARAGDAVQQHLALAARPPPPAQPATAARCASVSRRTTATSGSGKSSRAFSARFGGRGGMTSASARASVDPYSSAIHTASSSSAGGTRPITSSIGFSSSSSPSATSDHHAVDLARAERHQHARAGLQLDALGYAVVERPVDRPGGDQRLNARDQARTGSGSPSPHASRRGPTRSVRSHVKPPSSRPKWP